MFVVGDGGLDWRTQLRVAALEGGPDAMTSHASAGALWTAPRIGEGAVEVTVPITQWGPTRTLGRVHRRRPGLEEDRCQIDGIPVTSAARTLFDLGTRIGPRLLDEVLQDFARRDLVDLAQLRDQLERRRVQGLPGVRRFEEMLDRALVLPRADSWLEQRFLQLLADHGIPLPETQVWFEVDGARYRVDAVWHDIRLIVELNGYGTHSTRQEMTKDAERTARLQSLGYEVLPITHDQVVDQPQFVLAQIDRRRSALAG